MSSVIHGWAIEQTLKANWEENRFHTFKKYGSQKEFLESQMGFFYAVQAFPRMLCVLASKIEDSECRLAVVENIFEEHGKGDKKSFHVQSYKDYLIALGWDGVNIDKNPWVEDWIQRILEREFTAMELAAYLAGIEYVYALVCEDVVKYIDTLTLVAPQSHYAKHATIDWDHGRELLEVAISLNPDNNEEYLMSIMSGAQHDFLHMYGALFMPTLNEMKEYNKEVISFYYSRENSSIENDVLKSVKSDEPNVLMICSGGEHLFEMMGSKKPISFDMIDINEHQINLAKNKLQLLNNQDWDNAIFKEHGVGKFEKMFKLLRSYFSEDEKNRMSYGDPCEQKKLKYVVDILFSNKYLNAVFGDAATKYTVDSFAEHFFKIFAENMMEGENNTRSIFWETLMRDYRMLAQNMQEGNKNHHVQWILKNPKDLVSDKKYDIVDISNIGDWMEQEEFAMVVENGLKHLKKDGKIIARKLLGDYSLKDVFAKYGMTVERGYDTTSFYSEIVVASV